MNFDSDNASPSNKTYHQVQPGPAGGLTIEAALSTAEFPTLEPDVDNGFMVFVNPIAVSIALSPLTAPHAATTHVQVKAQKRLSAIDCAAQGHLSTMSHNIPYHDPEGILAFAERFLSVMDYYGVCALPLFGVKANDTAICKPHLVYVMTFFLAYDAQKPGQKSKPVVRLPQPKISFKTSLFSFRS